MIAVTVLAPSTAGTLSVAPNTSRPSTPLTFILFDSADSISNTGVVDVGTDGKIAVAANVSMNILIDVQGISPSGTAPPPPVGTFRRTTPGSWTPGRGWVRPAVRRRS